MLDVKTKILGSVFRQRCDILHICSDLERSPTHETLGVTRRYPRSETTVESAGWDDEFW